MKTRKILDTFMIDPDTRDRLTSLSKEASEKYGDFISKSQLIRFGVEHILALPMEKILELQKATEPPPPPEEEPKEDTRLVPAEKRVTAEVLEV